MSVGLDILCHKLQAVLDNRREEGRLIDPPSAATLAQMTDFGSNDSLSLSSSGVLSMALLRELLKHPNFTVGSTSSRILDGTKQYLEDIERDLAQFHRAESAMFFSSGYDANVAVWSAIPQPGDFVVYDEYVHASIHDGMRRGRATTVPFKHNDCESLRDCLKDIQAGHSAVSEGEQVVFISLESFYSVDGDLAPVQEMVNVVRDTIPQGNYVLAIDEAHSNGVVGPNGSGFICHYGLEADFGIRLQTCGKALGSTGAVVLANETIKFALLNYARSVIFSTAPSFLTVSAVKAGYGLLASEEGERRRCRLQRNLQYFYQTLTTSVEWKHAKEKGIFSLPTERTWRSQAFLAPIAAIVMQPGKAKELAQHLHQAKYWVNTANFPLVPKDKNRIRIVIHADNTENEIKGIVRLLREWAQGQLRLSERKSRPARM
ncbi:pyridoxal phosphate-dependent transferase [Aspergillus pseudonomiae]|uniref:Pyridoxal phosphate-dependent transferase n=1 Tax=Aspergillus pseudonomiae TaxID=1506151 RepID=A0A5N7DLB9_9EURO|nr:pyridoxal phosphate-dependent transferase [Aspergillus pseudonomiae]KAB8262878.1 pyridoxal phosphate-dependent transferase [Aspergillus pseudonomiae]KAE8406278.1 pyridoxal phosphate-dependent transferase [Aspergillus pseudonomiae]